MVTLTHVCHVCHCPLPSPSHSCLTPPSCLISLLPLAFLSPVSLLVFLSLPIALLLTWSLIHLTRMHTHMHVNTCTYTYAHVTAYTCHTRTPESCHLLTFWVCVLLKAVTSGSIHFPVNVKISFKLLLKKNSITCTMLSTQLLIELSFCMY